MTKLPSAVQRQVEDAERIERELYGDPQQPAAPAEPVIEPPAEPAVPQGPAEPAVQVPAQEVAEPVSENWQARFKTLQGKYNAEVPRLHEQLREAMSHIAELRANAQQVEPQKPEQPSVSKEDEETFGSDLIDLVRRVVRVEVGQLAAAMEREAAVIKENVGRVQEQVSETEYDRYLGKVTRLYPDWEKVNETDGWKQWLAQFDPILGATRQEGLNAAARALDVERTVAFFEAYAANLPKPQAVPAPQVQVVPRAQQATPTPARTNKRFYTQTEIAQMLDPRNLRRLSAERQREIEREIDEAVAEGRIL